jgi:hypothetical protein
MTMGRMEKTGSPAQWERMGFVAWIRSGFGRVRIEGRNYHLPIRLRLMDIFSRADGVIAWGEYNVGETGF